MFIPDKNQPKLSKNSWENATKRNWKYFLSVSIKMSVMCFWFWNSYVYIYTFLFIGLFHRKTAEYSMCAKMSISDCEDNVEEYVTEAAKKLSSLKFLRKAEVNCPKSKLYLLSQSHLYQHNICCFIALWMKIKFDSSDYFYRQWTMYVSYNLDNDGVLSTIPETELFLEF